MNQGDPLFLGFNDTGAEPVRWELIRTIQSSTGPMLLVRVSPAIMGQQFGLGGQDIEVVVLAPRLEGYTVAPVTKWPTPVYVLLPLVNLDNRDEIRDDEFRVIKWAELCRDMAEAEAQSRAGRWR
jgi:hypothetical protein